MAPGISSFAYKQFFMNLNQQIASLSVAVLCQSDSKFASFPRLSKVLRDYATFLRSPVFDTLQHS
jgi:hypothetical protein